MHLLSSHPGSCASAHQVPSASERLALADGQDQVLELASLEGAALDGLPVREHALRECLAAGLLPQGRNEAERLRHWQVSPRLHQGRALTLVLLEDAAAAQIHAGINAAHRFLR